MKTCLSLALMLCVGGLLAHAGAQAADNRPPKAKKLTTNQKIEQLNEQQHALLQWQERQQKQLQEMSQRLNAERAAAATSRQSMPYSYP